MQVCVYRLRAVNQSELHGHDYHCAHVVTGHLPKEPQDASVEDDQGLVVPARMSTLVYYAVGSQSVTQHGAAVTCA